MDFEQAMRDHDQKARETESLVGKVEAEQRAREVEAAATINQALRDMARFLATKGAARFQFVHVEKGKGLLAPSERTESPVGHVLRHSTSTTRVKKELLTWTSGLSLLCADGRLWRFGRQETMHRPTEISADWVDVTPEALGKYGIWGIGRRSVAIHYCDGLTTVEPDTINVPFMEYMAGLASSYLERGDQIEGPGLTRVP